MLLSDWARVEQVSANGRAEIGARRIYILPTRYGMIFAILVALMLLGAVNYGNNPAHLLTFLLAALGSNAIYLTWRNLRGLRLRCIGTAPVYARQTASLVIELDSDERERPALQFGFEGAEPIVLDLQAGDTQLRREVPLPELPRGRHRPGRLVASTHYPLGLFRAWCYIECESPVLVYPMPGISWHPTGTESAAADDAGHSSGSEDFAGLRTYLPGDQPSRIDWKSYARDRGLNTRLFSGQTSVPVWLDWQQAPGSDTEARLSALCRAVLDAELAGQTYGLRAPSGEIAPSTGASHRHRCLRLLAMHGDDHA